MEIQKAPAASAPATSRPSPKSTSTSNQRPTTAGRDRSILSKEPESNAKQPINFGTWATPGRALKKGVEAAPEVRSLQKALNLKQDGKFGPETERAVREFQERQQLKADGQVGSATAKALGSAGPIVAPSAALAGKGKVDAFSFRSTPQNPQDVKEFISKSQTAKKTPMIGIDPNNEPAKQAKIAKIAHENGAQTHKYLEGPGGPTGTGSNPKWERSEYERTRALADKEGIKLPQPPAGQEHFPVDDRGTAMKAWNDQGWQRQSIQQARDAKREGHSSVEVDNINRDFKGQDNSDEAKAVRAMGFYRKYAGEFQKGDMPTLMLKNLSQAELQAVSKAIDGKSLPRSMFSDFSINEYEAKTKPGAERNEMMSDLTRREQMTRQLGIEPLRSGDTYNYAARSGS